MSKARSSIAPLVVEFAVESTVSHAFDTWVRRAATWWPRDHTISGDPAAIEFDPCVGGRIVERDHDGNTHPWGEVVVWDPPNRVDYLWHLMFTPKEATTVSVTFTQSGETTLVRLEQVGWDSLGEQGPIRRERTTRGWSTVTDHYRRSVEPTGRGDRE